MMYTNGKKPENLFIYPPIISLPAIVRVMPGQYASFLAFEIRNPLTSVALSIDMQDTRFVKAKNRIIKIHQ
jgi:hypothetical protein